MLILFFLAASLAGALLYMYFSGALLWRGILAFLIIFISANLLYVLYLVAIALFINPAKPLSKQSLAARAALAGVGELLCGYALIRSKVNGIEKLPEGERFLLVSNHRSFFDPLVLMDKLRQYNIAYISKESTLRVPVIREVAHAAGCLPIDRENSRNALKTIVQAADYLKRGICSMAIYPEGTRTHGKELLEFHHGSFKVAQKANAPLVITSVQGTEKVRKNLFRRKSEVTVNILDVIPAERVQQMSTQELADYSRSLILSSLCPLEEKAG